MNVIGVIADSSDADTVQEFFELFKTPWEFYQPERSYDIVIVSAGEDIPNVPAKLLIYYSSSKKMVDAIGNAEDATAGRSLSYKGWRIPIYGYSTTFKNSRTVFLTEEKTERVVGYHVASNNNGAQIRIGYDLFREIKTLLTVGQPVENASLPTLELHIALLRDLIVESGVPLVEIPAIPDGYEFIACLTHDVDHPSIRLHRWDHTMWGFLYRAIVGSLVNVLRRRLPVRGLVANWVAAAKLPLVHLGLARDFWYEFDRYLEMEKDINSTFFVLPCKGNPGKIISGSAPRKRASSYGAADIADKIQRVVSAGGEVGLHGIDAWIDSTSGWEEMAQIGNVAGVGRSIGVRMHWLYFNEGSPAVLEKAGFVYDSTVGYNQTVGYRSGTTQVYKPLQVKRLLELPLHVMDTALFYPAYLNCTAEEAEKRVGEMINSACQFGGTVTFNWHDRSIAPERLWGEFYVNLIGQLKQKGAWCGSAGSVVSWFQNRRAVVFERDNQGLEVARTEIDFAPRKDVPGLRLRIYNARRDCGSSSERYVESAVTGNMNLGF